VLREGAWVVVSQDGGRRPLPRYEQGAALLGTQAFVLGGHYSGKYLEDLWVYDLASLQWSQAAASFAQQRGGGGGGAGSAAPPPLAGHSVTPWGGSLIVLGGHSKHKDPDAPMAARLLDPETMQWAWLEARGAPPRARGGHTASLVGQRLYVFGGEDCRRRPLADLHVLDLQTMEWAALEPPGAAHAKPAPRCGHAAVVCRDKLVVFGGEGGGARSAEGRARRKGALGGARPARGWDLDPRTSLLWRRFRPALRTASCLRRSSDKQAAPWGSVHWPAAATRAFPEPLPLPYQPTPAPARAAGTPTSPANANEPKRQAAP
jgi:hypothetical protein